jgi:hypothetical protein
MPGGAEAHIGAQVAVLTFQAPVDPDVMHGQMTDTVTPTPYVWTTADASYTIKWADGDTDPTGRFTFFYMDHEPTFQVDVDNIDGGGLATLIDDSASATPINTNGGFWASCYCSADQGVTCPVVTRDPSGNCANQFTWDTSGMAPGTYWLVAVNNDPPFHVYYPSNSPIRIAHGGTPLPAVVIMRPDGIGAWDTTYHLQWLADGTPPLTFGLQYGLEDTTTSLMPQSPLASALSLTPGSDGSYGYDWDVSQLDTSKAYWVRLTVTDGNGISTFTDSHFATTIFHDTGGTPPDMSMAMMVPPKKKSGCEIGQGESSTRGTLSLAAVIGALALAVYLARRAARRG